jgi:NAD(P)-dependent dehydrogenase (short-subunit alcohol dehydrogenase family)
VGAAASIMPAGMTQLRWDGRVAIVTGAGRNLGRAYARLLAARGARVLVNDLGVAISDTDGAGDTPSSDPAHDVVAEIEAEHGRGIAVASTDSVATPEGGEAIVAAATDAFGRVDVVVNNAGVVRQAPFEDYAPELADAVFASQLGGHFNVTRPAWRIMRAQGYGRVLNVSSGAGLWGVPKMGAYATAKMGVLGLTRTLAQEGRADGINVNVIAPSAKTREGGFGPIPPSPALNEWLSPELIAPLVAWLVHEDCDVSGECFSVGGGYVGRVVLAVTRGWRSRDLTPESVRDHFGDVMDEDGLAVMPVGTGDMARMFEGFGR